MTLPPNDDGAEERTEIRSTLSTADRATTIPQKIEQAAPPVSALSRPPRRARWWLVLAGLVFAALAAWFAGWHLWGMHHLRAADNALQRFEFKEALTHLESCLYAWPRRMDLRLEAARAARRGEQLDRAEEYLSQCEKAGITADTALERAMLIAQRGDLVQVELELSHLLRENHPDSVLILEAVVRGSIRIHRRRDAVGLLRLLLSKVSEHPEANFLLGSQLAESGLMADAVPYFQRALELAPQRTDFRLGLADALVGSSQPSAAWPHFEELLRQSPHDAGVLLGAARCRRALGQYQPAREFLDTLVRDHPNHAEGWAERGRVCREQGDSDEALRSLRKAFDLDPSNHRIGFSLLGELRGQKKSDEADALWKKIDHLIRQGKRLQELMNQLNRPGPNAPGRYEIGMIHMSNKSETEAESWLQGALQDDPGYQPAHAALADYYQRIGNSTAAQFHRRRAGKLKP
jgi:tetratricopeptide (TPR) repeat protein